MHHPIDRIVIPVVEHWLKWLQDNQSKFMYKIAILFKRTVTRHNYIDGICIVVVFVFCLFVVIALIYL